MSMLGLESLNPRASVAAQNYATQFLMADASEMMTISDEALANANAAAAGIDAICNIFDVATVCKRFDGMTKSVEALVGKEIVSLEYKDERTLWTKIKEFFVRLWHSIRDWFAKFNIGLNRCLKQLQSLSSAEWSDSGADFDKTNYHGLTSSNGKSLDITVKAEDLKAFDSSVVADATNIAEVIKVAATGAKMDGTSTPPEKLSDETKRYSAFKKAVVSAFKATSEGESTIKDLQSFNRTRMAFIADINVLIAAKETIVKGFESVCRGLESKNTINYSPATDKDSEKNVKDTSIDGDEAKARIRALKDQRHELMMLAVAIGKVLVTNANKFIAACKKIKKEKKQTTNP